MDNSGNNRYELLFLDDEDAVASQVNVAAIAVPAKKQEAPKAAKSKPEKENKPVAPKKATNAVVQGKSPVKGGKVANAGVKNQVTNGAHPGPVRSNPRFGNRENNHAGNSEFGNELPQRQFNNRDNRGPPRFRGGERGEKFGKREFDRQSGSDKTGVKAIDKRDGGGAHNWGSPKQDIEDLKTGESAPQADKDDSVNEVSAEAAIAAEEDESKQMTLDEGIVGIKFIFKDGSKDDGFRKGPAPGGGPRGEDSVERTRGEGGFRGDGPRGEGGFRPDGPRGEGGFRGADGPRGQRFNNNSNGYERQENNRSGDKRRNGPKPLKVDDEAQFPTLS
ncbi:LOW QUALITY PROTEIN: uncharacterized protein Dana_GF17890 [Drosophila ananassae]|uniref:Hyaluronan/mRNA-binding protein domain-containing protein n=1 Tax=Drosophila ananassae TaxID=7217 RepID=B3M267_DROAN|nr:LOW QUALITY PROTEIN: uncharacterized protein Dana_GF17890 [Drosophila ananassae]